MRLDRYLESRLARSRRTVQLLLAARRVVLDGAVETDGRRAIDRFARVEADGQLLQDAERLYLMLYKPRGRASATRDARHPTVLDLIEHPGKSTLHIAGRLDFNTTGLLLLTNDGAWSTRIMAPGSKLPKRYRVQLRDPLTDDYAREFEAGILLRHETRPTLPAGLRVLEPAVAEVTLHEGRYHQVRRMFAHFRNPVLALHRLAIGPLELDPALAPGDWRALTPAEISAVNAAPAPLMTASPSTPR